MTDHWYWIVALVLYFLTWLLIPWVLLKRSVHTSAAVGWIMAIIFLPGLGALLCAVVGTTRWENRADAKLKATRKIRDATPPSADPFHASDDELGRTGALSRLARDLTGNHALRGNQVRLIPDTQESLVAMEQMIREARRWVHVEFYILRHDETGVRLRDLLIEKAKAGVEVRLLYDGLGSIQLSRQFLRPLRQAGAQVTLFTPGFSLWHLLTLNLRNHRKLIVTDQQMAFTGGMNIGREYVRRTKSYGRWRDTQLVLKGPCFLQFQQMFAEDWLYATGEDLTAPDYLPSPVAHGDRIVQVIPEGPDRVENVLLPLVVAAIGLATRKITISTPYFVPPEALAISLEAAARRGVEVRLVLAGRGNFSCTLQAARSWYEQLQSAGAQIYEYQTGLYHPKVLVIDEEWAVTGTANWDFRSLMLNFEIGVALFDPELAAELEAHANDDCQRADKIDPHTWQQRSTWRRLHEQFWRLFAPML